jgi:hypothetical protein
MLFKYLAVQRVCRLFMESCILESSRIHQSMYDAREYELYSIGK